MTSHPRIVIPIIAVLAGSLSYAIFDPIRSFFVKSKVSSLFDWEKYRITKWLKKETIGRLGSLPLARKNGSDVSSADVNANGMSGTGIEAEREEAAEKLTNWLKDLPDTFVTINGPPGSGKTPLVQQVTTRSRNVLYIDCIEIVKEARGGGGTGGGGGEGKLVGALASQVGYFPQFQWASSFNNLIDIASVGLIGTKAGFSTNLDVQIKQVLDVTANALKNLSDEAKVSRTNQIELERQRVEMMNNDLVFVQNCKSGNLHDGRLDGLVAGSIFAELGMGLEPEPVYASATTDNDTTRRGYSQIWGPASMQRAYQATLIDTKNHEHHTGSSGRSSTADIDQMPIVIIKGFEDSHGKNLDVLWSSIAEWAATLVENRVSPMEKKDSAGEASFCLREI